MTQTFQSNNGSVVEFSLEQETSKRCIIRPFCQNDAAKIQNICFSQYRSTSISGVSYYIVSHIDDLIFLCILAFSLMNVKKALIAAILFIMYLFCKSRFEVENYIVKHCVDLKNIESYYKKKSNNNFWVAEVICDDIHKREIVGCIGLVSQDKVFGKIVRLTVNRRYHRMRIGSHLLKHAEQYAKTLNYEVLYMYTNSLNPSHASFVTAHGYQLVNTIPRGLMRGDLFMWKRVLKQSMGATSDDEHSSITKLNILD